MYYILHCEWFAFLI